MTECNGSTTLLENLDIAVLQLRQFLDNQQIARSTQCTVMTRLASTFSMRFMCKNETNDLEEALDLRCDLHDLQEDGIHTATEGQANNIDSMMEKIEESLTAVRRSIPLHDIDTIISTLQTLNDLSSETITRQAAVPTILAEALYYRFYHSFVLTDLADGVSHLQSALKLEISEKGCLYSYITHRLCNFLATRFDATNDENDLEEALSQFVGVHTEETTTSAGVEYVSLLHSASYSQEQFTRSGNTEDLNTAMNTYRKAISDLPVQDDNYLAALCNLSNTLATRFEQNGQQNDLDESILLIKEALQLRPPSHSSHSGCLTNLACSLLIRFEKADGQHKDIDEAILLHREVLFLRPPAHPKRSNTLANLAAALQTRFVHGGQMCDLDEAIRLHKEVMGLRVSSDPDRLSSLTNLAGALSIRYERLGQEDDISEALSLYKELLDLIVPTHPGYSIHLNCLASALSTKFCLGGHQMRDLDDAISFYEQALALHPTPDPRRPDILNDLATSVWTRYEHTYEERDIENAIILLEEALGLQASSASRNRSNFLFNLASVLWTRFRQGSGPRSDIHRAILHGKEGLALQTVSHSHRSEGLTILGNALWARYNLEGQHDDLQEAISLSRRALDLQGVSHPNRFTSLNNLAAALLERFSQGGQRRDLDEVISLHKEVGNLRRPPHPERAQSLINFSVALFTLYETAGQKENLKQSIELCRQALDLVDAQHPKWHMVLTNLATALRAQFSEDGDSDNLDEAITLHRQAIDTEKIQNRQRPGLLHNLAIAVSNRFEHAGRHEDFDEAFALYERTLDIYPLSHPTRALSLQGLGKLLVHAHLLTGRNESEYLERAMSTFSFALEGPSALPVHARFLLARTWASYAEVHRHPSALEAYDAVLQVVPQLAAFGLDIQSRREALSTGSDGLARKAAYCAITHGRLDRAIEYLEAGRAVFWSQALRLRTPFDQLRTVAPELGERLHNIATALERGSHRNTFFNMLDNRAKMTMEEETSQLEKLSKEWLQGLDEVRNIAGFEDFLKSPRLSSLKIAAANSPVVFLIPNDHASDCVIMTSTTTHHIPLSPKLCTSELRKLVKMTQSAALSSTVAREGTEDHSDLLKITEDRLGARRLGGTVPSDDVFRIVLQTLWTEVVKPVIEILGIQISDKAPARVLWCPTGLFTFLPIHAAGCYDGTEIQECASDYIVSSYTPTIGLLLSQNNSAAQAKEHFKMLAVVDTKLFFAKEEIKKIEARVPSGSLMKLGVPGAPALAETVISQLLTASIVHFACHGKQDRSNPLHSALLVDDGELMISRIMQEPLPNGSLAFLCACETAMGDETLPDEAMSLGASILFSGFRTVVATMWKMADADGPIGADAFYEELLCSPDVYRTSRLDVSRSAEALNKAVQTLRSKGVEFRRWVPFIHLGR